jgi:hypothetical protein
MLCTLKWTSLIFHEICKGCCVRKSQTKCDITANLQSWRYLGFLDLTSLYVMKIGIFASDYILDWMLNSDHAFVAMRMHFHSFVLNLLILWFLTHWSSVLFSTTSIKGKNRCSIVTMVTRLWDGQPRNCGSLLSMCKRLLFKNTQIGSWAYAASYSANSFACR